MDMSRQQEQTQDLNNTEDDGDQSCCMVCLAFFMLVSVLIWIGSLFSDNVYMDTASNNQFCMGPHNTKMMYTPRFPQHELLTDPQERLDFLRQVTSKFWIIDHYADRLPDKPSQLTIESDDYKYDPMLQAAEWVIRQDNQVFTSKDDILERFALAVVFKSMGGPNWQQSRNWLDTSKSVCDWHGVTCWNDENCDAYAQGKVISIDLAHNNLRGPFQEVWILLTELRSLRVNDNSILGGFWGFSIGHLPYLREAYLQNNRLQGEIHCDFIVENEALETLHLYGNDFSGPVSYKMCEPSKHPRQASGGPVIPRLLVDCKETPCSCCDEFVHCFHKNL